MTRQQENTMYLLVRFAGCPDKGFTMLKGALLMCHAIPGVSTDKPFDAGLIAKAMDNLRKGYTFDEAIAAVAPAHGPYRPEYHGSW